VGHVSFHACDIRNEDAVKTTVAAIVIAHGRIDGLVNNAGGQYITPLESISAKGWDAVVATNLTGGFLMARECYLQSMQATAAASSTSWPTSGAPCRAWATAARRARAW
jgi:citronellol/citronellal dehydrogenase